MRRIRRKRQKYTWMPTLGGKSTSGDSSYGTSSFGSQIFVDGPALGPTDLYVTPIVPDQTLFVDAQAATTKQDHTLRDFTEGQDWLLKRIVGKLHIAVPQVDRAQGTAPRLYYVGAGFFVGRADDASPDVPDTNNAEIDPLGSENIRQPWIWRRTWVLQNQLAVAAVGDSEGFEDNNVVNAPSGLDGPHLDAKSARRIRREERLWFVINAYGTNNLGVQDQGGYAIPGLLRFRLDYRVLGAMRRSNNRSTF